jgi:nitrite reductase/ring-hydroxylating ferredoxin subunit/uncharacterized membrane protein
MTTRPVGKEVPVLLEAAMKRLEQATALDELSGKLAAVVHAATRPRPVKNALSGGWLGHRLHPALIPVPIGFWSGALIFDLVATRRARWAADVLVGAGVASALPTAAAGASDWSDTEGAERRVGFVHALGNSAALVCFTASWVARKRGRRAKGVALALAGHAFAGFSGYLGGHLTYATGVGVDTTAFQSGPEDWTPVLDADEVPEGRAVGADVGGVRLLLVRDGSEVRALAARCTHRGGPLDEGDVADGCVTCPWHGSRFELATGDIARGPATSPQPAYETRVVAGRVEVRRSEPRDGRHPAV